MVPKDQPEAAWHMINEFITQGTLTDKDYE